MDAFLLALGCARAWLTLLFADPALPVADGLDIHGVFDILFCIASCAAACGCKHAAIFCASPRGKAAAGCCMAAASALSLTAGVFPSHAEALSLASAAVGGIGFAAFLLVWAETLSALSIARIALYSALSQLFAVVLVFFCQGLDVLRTSIALVVLPACAACALSIAYRSSREAPSEPRETPPVRTARSIPWKLIVLTAVFCFAYGLRDARLAGGAGMHSSISTAMAMAALAAGIFFFSDRISLNAVIKSALPLMLCGFLLVPCEGFIGSVLSSYMISIGYSLMSLLVSLMLYDISKRFGIAVVCLLGLKNAMQAFVVAGGWLASHLDVLALARSTQDAIVAAIVAALLFFVAFILYSEKELTSTWGVKFMEAEALTEEGLRRKRIAERCDELCRTCRLSPREDEILRLYAQGMNGPRIEKELFIASGTLKTHTRHIYEKLGISSRKELYDVLGVKR